MATSEVCPVNPLCHDSEILEYDPSGRYVRYQQQLGKGSFKKVYKAFDQVTGLEVAWSQIKNNDVLRSNKNIESLYSEVLFLRSLKHDHIIRYYNSWVDDKKKNVNIITELFSSGNLRQYREKYKMVDMKAVKGWARQILMGLDYLHSHNPPVIHRDLKCDNIFVNGNSGEVKIGDLGVATVMEKANPNTAIGTLEFMAPEFFDEDYDELVDIYSFGMCMLEMVTCEFPYSECKDFAQIYKKISSGIKPAALYTINDPQTREFIEKCLRPASERQSAKELLNDPYLQIKGSLKTRPLALPDIEIPKIGPFEDRCLMSEGPISAPSRLSNMDIDYDDEMPVITKLEYLDNEDLPFCAEIKRVRNECVFVMSGQRKDHRFISVTLRTADHMAGRAQEITFPFFFDNNDTAISVSKEMVDEQLEFKGQSIIFMVEMLDLLMLYLIPSWATSVPVDHLVQKNRPPRVTTNRQKKSPFHPNSLNESVDKTELEQRTSVTDVNLEKSNAVQNPNSEKEADSFNSYQSAQLGFVDLEESLPSINGEIPTNIHQGDNEELQFQLELVERQFEETTQDVGSEKLNQLVCDADFLMINSLVID